MVDLAVFLKVVVDEDGAEVADGGFVCGGVQGDLGAEVAAVDDADVILGAADVAGVFEGDPGVAGLKDGFEHALPEVDGGDLAAEDFAGFGFGFILGVAFFEGGAEEVVQIGDFVGAEKGPVFPGFHAFHEEVGDPVRGVEVVGAAAVVTGVDAKLQEVFDVVVPDFEVGAAGATAFAALVDGDELVVVKFEEGDDALGLAIGAFDVAAGAANGGPGAAEAAGPLREEGVFGDAANHDGLDAVIHLVEVTGGKLGVHGAGVEQRGGAGAEAAGFVEAVEGDDALFGIAFFVDAEAHGDAHPEELGGFEALGGLGFFVDDEVAVVQGLDAEEVEVHVGSGVEGVGEAVEVELQQAGVDALDFDASGEVAAEGAAVEGGEGFDAVAGNVPAEDFLINVGEQDAGGELGEVRVMLHHGAGIQDDGGLEGVLGDFGEDGAAELHFDFGAVEAEIEAEGGEVDAFFEVLAVPEEGVSVVGADEDEGLLLLGLFGDGDGFLDVVGVTQGVAHGAILDVGAGDFEVALFHELLFDEVLYVLDVDELLAFFGDGAADGFGDGDGRGGVELHGEEGFADSNLDFVVVPRHELAAAADDFGVDENRLGGGGGADTGEEFVATAFAFFSEGPGDVVGVLPDEGALDDVVDFPGVDGRRSRRLPLPCFGLQFLDDSLGDAFHQAAVVVVVNVLLFLTGEEEIGDGTANGVSDFTDVEVSFICSDQDFDGFAASADDAGREGTPFELGFLIFGSVGDALEMRILLEQVIEHGGRGAEGVCVTEFDGKD